jgi:hypothetical protein
MRSATNERTNEWLAEQQDLLRSKVLHVVGPELIGPDLSAKVRTRPYFFGGQILANVVDCFCEQSTTQ